MFDDFKNAGRDVLNAAKNLQEQLMRLQDCLNELNQAMDGVAEFSRAAQHAVNLWQFKNEPRLIKIQKLLSKYQA
ncbi:hypothetical protein ACLUXQ_04715 [Limosilactobacillus mucosae]